MLSANIIRIRYLLEMKHNLKDKMRSIIGLRITDLLDNFFFPSSDFAQSS